MLWLTAHFSCGFNIFVLTLWFGVDGVYDKCDIEYEIPLIGHYLKKEDVYYTSVKTAIVMLEANGILTIDNDHNAMLTRKGKRYIEINERELVSG